MLLLQCDSRICKPYETSCMVRHGHGSGPQVKQRSGAAAQERSCANAGAKAQAAACQALLQARGSRATDPVCVLASSARRRHPRVLRAGRGLGLHHVHAAEGGAGPQARLPQGRHAGGAARTRPTAPLPPAESSVWPLHAPPAALPSPAARDGAACAWRAGGGTMRAQAAWL